MKKKIHMLVKESRLLRHQSSNRRNPRILVVRVAQGVDVNSTNPVYIKIGGSITTTTIVANDWRLNGIGFYFSFLHGWM